MGCQEYCFRDQRVRSSELIDRLYKRMVSATPHDADILSSYAIFLEEQCGDLDGAEIYFKRALEANPKRAHYYGNYAVFLAQRRGDLDGAEIYFKQALESNPKDAHILGSYALFLKNQGGDLDRAEVYFKRALEASPKSARYLGNYAIFLAQQRGDLDGAEAYFKRALEADPKHAIHLGNYGQFLVELARLSEGEQLLVSAFEYSDQYDRSNVGNIAEICYSLWLVARMQKHTVDRWEGYFKFLIQKGFKRHPWSFERMLDQAKKILSPEEFEYAEALAHAFLDESQVSTLDRYERWRTLEPLDPMEAGNKYSERTPASIPSTSS